MHQLFVTLFAVLLSFAHHSAGSRSMEASVTYNVAKPSRVLSFPGRQQFARTVSYPSYAGSACSSCQLTTTSFSAR